MQQMKPNMLHKICAHPVVVTWVLGACALNAVLIGSLLGEVPLRTIITDWQVMQLLLIAFIPSTLLGYFLGMFTCWPLIRVICSRINGAPLQPGDEVMILSGPDKGIIAKVYEITRGQGGWELARLDLGIERKKRLGDLYEEYSLLKIRRSDYSVNESLSNERTGSHSDNA